MKAGDMISATATEIAVYGIHCVTAEGKRALLLIPYISWIPCFNSCTQFADPGDKIDAAVRFVDERSGEIALTHCEMFDDPWASNQFTIGSRFRATAIRHVESSDRCGGKPALLVRMIPGSYAMLCGDHSDIEIGAVVPVTITDVCDRKRSVAISKSQSEGVT